jgi:hypothetical protein
MYHYVYYSYEEWGRGYIGVRSCECLPEEDCSYFGSFYDKTFAPKNKIILAVFETREEAIQAEITLHAFYQVHINPHFANKARQTSTKFTGTGGFDKCVERNPNFFSEAGKIGGKVTYEKYPEMYSENGRIGYQKGIKRWREDNPNWVEDFREFRMKGVTYFQNNPEAAKARAANGVKALREYWERVGQPDRKGQGGTPLRVELPDGEVKFYDSIRLAAEDLGIPRTTMKRMAKGRIVKRYENYKVTKVGQSYNGSEGEEQP